MPKWVSTPRKKNSYHIFKMVILSKIFDDVKSYVIRWNAGKKINPISEHFIKQKFEFKSGCIVFHLSDVSSIRDCHTTFLVKNTLFEGEVAWQPLKELQICSCSILNPPTRAFKWDIVCLSTIINFEEIRGYVKKCLFLLYKINIFWHNLLFSQKLW